MRTVVCFVAVFACSACFASPEIVTLEAILWEPTLDAEFRTDASGLTGTRLAPTDLNWDPTIETYGAHVRLSFLGLAVCRLSYHSLFFEGTTTLTQNIVLDKNVFLAGTSFHSSLLMERYGLGVLAPLIPLPVVKINLGVYLGATRYILRGTGTILALPPRRETVTIDTYMPIAAPMFEVIAGVPGLRWLRGIASAAFIAYSEKDQKVGRYLRVKVAARFALGPIFAAEAGLLSQSTDYEDKDPKKGFKFHEVTTGFFCGVTISI